MSEGLHSRNLAYLTNMILFIIKLLRNLEEVIYIVTKSYTSRSSILPLASYFPSHIKFNIFPADTVD